MTVFGFIAAMVACYKGIYAKGGPKGVGDAVNQAVVLSFILLALVNVTTLLTAHGRAEESEVYPAARAEADGLSQHPLERRCLTAVGPELQLRVARRS